MIGVSLEVTVERDLPFVAIALDEISDPLLLFWRYWPVTAFIFIVELHAVQVSGESFAHGGIVFLHHTVIKTREAGSPYYDGAFVIPAALTAFQCLGHYTSGYLQMVWGVLRCQESQTTGLHGALIVGAEYIP